VCKLVVTHRFYQLTPIDACGLAGEWSAETQLSVDGSSRLSLGADGTGSSACDARLVVVGCWPGGAKGRAQNREISKKTGEMAARWS
jgi:hypothetical protein